MLVTVSATPYMMLGSPPGPCYETIDVMLSSINKCNISYLRYYTSSSP